MTSCFHENYGHKGIITSVHKIICCLYKEKKYHFLDFAHCGSFFSLITHKLHLCLVYLASLNSVLPKVSVSLSFLFACLSLSCFLCLGPWFSLCCKKPFNILHTFKCKPISQPTDAVLGLVHRGRSHLLNSCPTQTHCQTGDGNRCTAKSQPASP